MGTKIQNSTHKDWDIFAPESQGPTLNSRYHTIPWDDQLVSQWKADYLVILSPWKRQCFVLNGVNTYFGQRFVVPAHEASAKNIIPKLIEWLIYHHIIAFDNKTHFNDMEVLQWPHDNGICCFYHIPHLPEAAI